MPLSGFDLWADVWLWHTVIRSENNYYIAYTFHNNNVKHEILWKSLSQCWHFTCHLLTFPLPELKGNQISLLQSTYSTVACVENPNLSNEIYNLLGKNMSQTRYIRYNRYNSSPKVVDTGHENIYYSSCKTLLALSCPQRPEYCTKREHSSTLWDYIWNGTTLMSIVIQSAHLL